MYELRKFELGIKNTFDRYLNCALLNARTLRGLINQSILKKRRMIVRKCNNNDNEFYINELINKRNFKNILELKIV